jgi:uncharacterized protein
MKGNKPPKDTKIYLPALLMVVHPTRYYYPQRDHSNLVTALLEHSADFHVTDEEGNTALHYACESNLPKTVKVLLEYGINPNVRNTSGYTPLMGSYGISKDVTCLQLLLEYGADINATDSDGRTALMYACMLAFGPLRIHQARWLLEHGAKASFIDRYQMTALDCAWGNDDRVLLRLLKAAIKKEKAEQKSSNRTAPK